MPVTKATIVRLQHVRTFIFVNIKSNLSFLISLKKHNKELQLLAARSDCALSNIHPILCLEQGSTGS
jgi:hypothetical protein